MTPPTKFHQLVLGMRYMPKTTRAVALNIAKCFIGSYDVHPPKPSMDFNPTEVEVRTVQIKITGETNKTDPSLNRWYEMSSKQENEGKKFYFVMSLAANKPCSVDMIEHLMQQRLKGLYHLDGLAEDAANYPKKVKVDYVGRQGRGFFKRANALTAKNKKYLRSKGYDYISD